MVVWRKDASKRGHSYANAILYLEIEKMHSSYTSLIREKRKALAYKNAFNCFVKNLAKNSPIFICFEYKYIDIQFPKKDGSIYILMTLGRSR